jgi:hypothetical protein
VFAPAKSCVQQV